MPPRQAPRKQLLHQAALDDLRLIDDRLGLLDGVVHRGEDGGNLALLGKGRKRQWIRFYVTRGDGRVIAPTHPGLQKVDESGRQNVLIKEAAVHTVSRPDYCIAGRNNEVIRRFSDASKIAKVRSDG